jgi:oxygen-dependent protoporphyrinogen oxidase
MTSTEAFDAVVIGAGVAGLVAAVALQRSGLHTLLVERANVAGGLLRREHLGSLVVDAGAESFATRNSSVADVLAELGLGSQLVQPDPSGAKLLTGRLHGRRRLSALPRGTVLGIPSRPWSREVRACIGVVGAARACLDVALPASYGSTAMSLGGLARMRMGHAVSTNLVDAICRSVYSAPADEIDLDGVAPLLRAALVSRGSLNAAVASVSSRTQPGGAVAGIRGGMWSLAAGLSDAFQHEGGTLRTGTTAREVRRLTDTYRIWVTGRQDDTQFVSAREVVMALPGPAVPAVLAGLEPALAQLLVHARFRGVTVACALVTCAELDDHPVGTGVIAAVSAGTRAKALTHVNAKWAWYRDQLGPHEHIVRVAFDGTDRQTVEFAGDRRLLAVEISALTGLEIAGSDISAVVVTPWANAGIPLDSQARRAFRSAGASAEQRHITFVGSWVSGTGLASVIPHAAAAAQRIIQRNTTPREREHREY